MQDLEALLGLVRGLQIREPWGNSHEQADAHLSLDTAKKSLRIQLAIAERLEGILEESKEVAKALRFIVEMVAPPQPIPPQEDPSKHTGK